jgi:hypothetical protein
MTHNPYSLSKEDMKLTVAWHAILSQPTRAERLDKLQDYRILLNKLGYNTSRIGDFIKTAYGTGVVVGYEEGEATIMLDVPQKSKIDPEYKWINYNAKVDEFGNIDTKKQKNTYAAIKKKSIRNEE